MAQRNVTVIFNSSQGTSFNGSVSVRAKRPHQSSSKTFTVSLSRFTTSLQDDSWYIFRLFLTDAKGTPLVSPYVEVEGYVPVGTTAYNLVLMNTTKSSDGWEYGLPGTNLRK